MTTNTTIHRTKRLPGSTQRVWTVDRNGLPFGQIWKFVDDIAGTYHAKTLEGNHQMFNTLEEAKDFMVTTRWWEAA